MRASDQKAAKEAANKEKAVGVQKRHEKEKKTVQKLPAEIHDKEPLKSTARILSSLHIQTVTWQLSCLRVVQTMTPTLENEIMRK